MITTALILAAGPGSRLAAEALPPKPLRVVGGLTLVGRAILIAAKAGLKRAIVVTGFERERVGDFLARRAWPIDVETIENPDWSLANGVSVLAARWRISEPFVLMMADHVFAPAILPALLKEGLGPLGARLAVDYGVSGIFDLPDATKADAANGLVRDIGKDLVRYNAVDTGLFLMTPEIFEALSGVRALRGDCSLTDGVRELALRGRVGVHDIGGGFWQDVDTPASLKIAEDGLLAACRKFTDGFVSRHLNRYVSLFLSRLLVRTPVTANQVTVFTTLVGLLSGLLAARGSYASFLAGAFLFKLASILDGVDGEMAKLRLTDSLAGQWFDTVSDNLTYVMFVVGTVIGVGRRTDIAVPPLLGIAALTGLLMLMAVMFTILITATKSGSLLAIQKDFAARERRGFLGRLWGRIYFVIKRDFFAALFLVLAVFDLPQAVLWTTALATNIAWIVLVRTLLASRRAA